MLFQLTITVNPPAMHLLDNLLLGIPELPLIPAKPPWLLQAAQGSQVSALIYLIFSPKFLPGETEAPSQQWDSSGQILLTPTGLFTGKLGNN